MRGRFARLLDSTLDDTEGLAEHIAEAARASGAIARVAKGDRVPTVVVDAKQDFPQTMSVAVYNEHDFKIEMPNGLAGALGMPNFLRLRSSTDVVELIRQAVAAW